MTQPVDNLYLKDIEALHEWNEGHEELESIPHAFAVAFKDGQGSWSMFTDSEDEKVNLFVTLTITSSDVHHCDERSSFLGCYITQQISKLVEQ